MLIKMLKCFQVGTDEDGKILSMKGSISENAGSHWNEHVYQFTESHWKNCYDSSSWNVKISDVKTDLPTNVYCRSPGMSHAMQVCGEVLGNFAAWTVHFQMSTK
jgi:xanthine dehydrogenase molybdopterin-binding subunit B